MYINNTELTCPSPEGFCSLKSCPRSTSPRWFRGFNFNQCQELYDCKQCYDLYRRRNSIDWAFKSCKIDTDTKALLKCSECNYHSPCVRSFQHHQEHHRWTPKVLQMFDCTEQPKSYECYSCNFQAFCELDFIRHIDEVHQTKAVPLINVVTYPDNIQEDVQVIPHSNCVKINCANCHFMRLTRVFLKKHHLSECNCRFSKLEQVSCDDNREAISDNIKQMIRTYNKLNINVTVYQFKCLTCFKKCKLQGASDLKDTFKCYQCSYKTTKKIYLKAHIKNKHSLPDQIIWLNCKYCSYKTKRKSQLERHQRCTHENVRNFPCNQCLYKAKYKVHLAAHVLNVHTKLRPYPCEYCPYKAKNKPTLDCHITSQHIKGEELNRFQCEHCPYKAGWKYLIRRHMINVHTPPEGVNWYYCPSCAYKAKRRNHVVLHVSKKHKELMTEYGKAKVVDKIFNKRDGVTNKKVKLSKKNIKKTTDCVK